MRLIFILLCLTFALPVLADPHAYNATKGYGIFHSSTDDPFFDIQVTAVTLTSETTELDGRKRLSFGFMLSNPGGGYQEEVAVFIDSEETLPWPVEFVSIYAEVGDLAPGTPAVPTVATSFNSATFIVAAADAGAAKTAILAGQHIHVTCKELYQFDMPVREADATMNTAFVDGTQGVK